MPFKYIGRTTDFKGKTLWEIVGNLKNFGVGRIVARIMFERYPEPSYMKIMKVEALPTPTKPSLDDQRKVEVWVEKTFRGKRLPKLLLIEAASYKTDYILIPKDEETAYCGSPVPDTIKILPKYTTFPLLLRELIVREMVANGEPVLEPKLELVYRKDVINKYKIATEGGIPNVEVTYGLGKPISPSLYNGIKL